MKSYELSEFIGAFGVLGFLQKKFGSQSQNFWPTHSPSRVPISVYRQFYPLETNK